MASPVIIQHVVSENRKSLQEHLEVPRPSQASFPGQVQETETWDESDAADALERRIASKGSPAGSAETAEVKSHQLLETSMLLRKRGCRCFCIKRSSAWRECFACADSLEGTFQIWDGSRKPADSTGLATESSFKLEDLLAVAQPLEGGASRELHLIFKMGRRREVLEVRCTEKEDFFEWLSLLSKYARVTGDC
eukprot:TRINITY_DN64499_c0_g1_i1.p1 TRINITY_DN64499_c0_g1~~TRINITY_DN64499_c0_g1_i1.p1  ORF type:complete len:194 (+),score=37.28 TRINITY_DN64499_c0_g1_i1:58-639(+)